MINRNEYTLCTAKNFLCVPTVLQIVLLYYGIKITADEIVKYFTVYVPESHKEIDGIKTSNQNEYGIKLSTNSINDFFKELDISLKEEYISIFQYEDWTFDEAVNHLLNTDKHIICGFSYGSLYSEPENTNIGHVSIITDKHGSKIQLLDPGPRNAGLRYVEIDDLYLAIKRKRDGLWLISQI